MISLSWERVTDLIKSNEDILKYSDYDCLLAVARGGLVPAVIISHLIGTRDVYVINLKRNCTNKMYSKKMDPQISYFDKNILSGKNILVVEDIVNTGESISKLLDYLSGSNYNRVDIFSLVKHDEYKGSIFYGIKTKEWVKFPWE